MRLAVSFTNLGPYHLARLRALGRALAEDGGTLVAIETASREQKYPWQARSADEPSERISLFPDRTLEAIPADDCARAMRGALDVVRPDAVAVAGYVRPEAMAAVSWASRRGRPSVLMSESQAIDRPRVWWKELVKSRRLRRFDAALVGGPSHRDYLIDLGFPADRIALGYNAVDNDRFAWLADEARRDLSLNNGLPGRPFVLSVARFVPEKNLPALVRAFSRYRETTTGPPWDLVLCGDGPDAPVIREAARRAGVEAAVHLTGFLQDDGLAGWYAHASGFILPSLSEPWGLVGNEAAACGLPLLISDRCGCARTLVPEPGSTGLTFDPTFEPAIAATLTQLADTPEPARRAMGRRAAEVVAEWGPERFASGMIEALRLAGRSRGAPNRRRAEAGTR